MGMGRHSLREIVPYYTTYNSSTCNLLLSRFYNSRAPILHYCPHFYHFIGIRQSCRLSDVTFQIFRFRTLTNLICFGKVFILSFSPSLLDDLAGLLFFSPLDFLTESSFDQAVLSSPFALFIEAFFNSFVANLSSAFWSSFPFTDFSGNSRLVFAAFGWTLMSLITLNYLCPVVLDSSAAVWL